MAESRYLIDYTQTFTKLPKDWKIKPADAFDIFDARQNKIFHVERIESDRVRITEFKDDRKINSFATNENIEKGILDSWNYVEPTWQRSQFCNDHMWQTLSRLSNIVEKLAARGQQHTRGEPCHL